jgi:hypothetical protein
MAVKKAQALGWVWCGGFVLGSQPMMRFYAFTLHQLCFFKPRIDPSMVIDG